jgi:2,4-diketo-3-deoxy-L-fuconate hydrolase
MRLSRFGKNRLGPVRDDRLKPRQKANTRDLIIDVPGLIAFATGFYTLMPGDVLLTGTPEGVGPIKGGDVIGSAISGIGEVTTLVRS